MLDAFVEKSATSNRDDANRLREYPHISAGFTRIIRIWIGRRRQRRVLTALEDRLLADIGLSRDQAGREAVKPFWKR
ncbi:MAG: DUF1127 domain-containing protein [Proteobacteria bacterium]|nr:DUF1127 domain-containing protein [Pseudomonadota bacterium]